MDQKGVVWTWKGDVREDKSGDGLRGDGKRDWGVRARSARGARGLIDDD